MIYTDQIILRKTLCNIIRNIWSVLFCKSCGRSGSREQTILCETRV